MNEASRQGLRRTGFEVVRLSLNTTLRFMREQGETVKLIVTVVTEGGAAPLRHVCRLPDATRLLSIETALVVRNDFGTELVNFHFYVSIFSTFHSLISCKMTTSFKRKYLIWVLIKSGGQRGRAGIRLRFPEARETEPRLPLYHRCDTNASRRPLNDLHGIKLRIRCVILRAQPKPPQTQR